MRKRLILVVDDEPAIVRLLRATLERDGYAVIAAERGEAALELAERERPDLVVLDVMMPGIDGYETLRRLRARAQTPVILLTARAGDADKLHGFQSGADDYLTKPFGVRELVARARALLRRPRGTRGSDPASNVDGGVDADAPPIEVHGIFIDPPRRRVRVDGRDVELTDQEFRLLHLFATHAGIVFSREALLARIWRGDTYVTVRSVDTLVKRLRRRIETDPANPRFLLTVWGVGYKFADI
jgi:DNA-binding response OmpR family regulator